jgi:hypothetical protein
MLIPRGTVSLMHIPVSVLTGFVSIEGVNRADFKIRQKRAFHNAIFDARKLTTS